MSSDPADQHAEAPAPERPSNRSSAVRDTVIAISIVATALATGLGAYIGMSALNIYTKSNGIAIRNRLEDVYNRISAIYTQRDGSKFANIFLYADYSKYDSPDEVRNLAVNQLIDIMPDVIPNRSSAVEEIAPLLSEGLPRISCEIWNYDGVNKASMQNLRRAYFHAELYAFILHSAWDAHALGVFTQEEFDYWAAFADEIEGNPLFLMTIHDGHRLGYFQKGFSEWIWRRLHRNELEASLVSPGEMDISQRKLLCSTFPDMASNNIDHWMGLFKSEDGFCNNILKMESIDSCNSLFSAPNASADTTGAK